MPETYVTLLEAAEELNIKPGWVYQLLRRHDLEGYKEGGEWRISASSVKAYQERQQKQRAATE